MSCSFSPDQRCLKDAGCATHGIECMRKEAALSFSMGPSSQRCGRDEALEEAAKVCKREAEAAPMPPAAKASADCDCAQTVRYCNKRDCPRYDGGWP